MATSSILRNIIIKDKELAKGLVDALENAENKQAKEVKISKIVKNTSRNEIKSLFKKK